jgi:hypothetical protein
MKYWEIIADNSRKPAGVWATSQHRPIVYDVEDDNGSQRDLGAVGGLSG